MTNVGVKAPKECEERELKAFYGLVQRGREVDNGGLLGRVRKASTTVVIVCRVSYPSRMNRDGGADGGFGLVGRDAAVV
jgi:hypothetical protein